MATVESNAVSHWCDDSNTLVTSTTDRKTHMVAIETNMVSHQRDHFHQADVISNRQKKSHGYH